MRLKPEVLAPASDSIGVGGIIRKSVGYIKDNIAPEGTAVDSSSRLISLLGTDALGPNAGLVKWRDFVSKTYGISESRLTADYQAGKFVDVTIADSAAYIHSQSREAAA